MSNEKSKFTTNFLYVRHSLDRQTSCRSYPELTMTNLIKNINAFFDVVDLDSKGLNRSIIFLKEYACADANKNFIVSSVNTSLLLASDTIRCKTMHNIMDIVYDDLREVSYIESNKSFDPMQLKYPRNLDPTINEIKENQTDYKNMDTPLHEFFVGLWIVSFLEFICETHNL